MEGGLWRMKKLLTVVALALVLMMPATALTGDNVSTAESMTTGFIAKLNIGDPDLTVVQNGPLRVLARCEDFGSGRVLSTLIATSDEPFIRFNSYPALAEVQLQTITSDTLSQFNFSGPVGFTSYDGTRAILFVRDMPFTFFQFGADCTIHGEAVKLKEVYDDE